LKTPPSGAAFFLRVWRHILRSFLRQQESRDVSIAGAVA